MRNTTLPFHAAVLGANLIYGINYSIAKEIMPAYIQPFGFILCRVAAATLLFWLLHALFIQEKIQRKHLPRLFVCGIFGVAVNQLFFFGGLNITSPINAAIIMTINPILVLLAAVVLIKERLNMLKISGIAMGISGALYLLLMRGEASLSTATLEGDVYIFINAASYAFYLVWVKPLMQTYHPITIVKWVFLFGLLPVLPIGWNEFLSVAWQDFTPAVWYAFIFVLLATTFFAYLLNTIGLKKLTPGAVASYIYLQPVFSALVAVWLGMDTIDLGKIISAILIFTGVYMVSRPARNTTKFIQD